ncbi:hypothetical protein BgiMline_016926 [Biomphalaria glabrata]|nr:hypothetical protein BgiMline_009682 [Biomphalaria glabrata]
MLTKTLQSLALGFLVLIQASSASGRVVTRLVNDINGAVTKCQGDKSCFPDMNSNSSWILAFRGTAAIGKPVYPAYVDGTGLPKRIQKGCMQVGQNLPCSNHFRNNTVLDNWKNISEVALVIYKNSTPVHHVIFNGSSSTYMTWMDKNKIESTSWVDIYNNSANYFGIFGHQENAMRRTFFMNHNYGTCPNDQGWFVAVDNILGDCMWEQTPKFPMFKYSTGNIMINWNEAKTDHAEYFAVFVKYNKST